MKHKQLSKKEYKYRCKIIAENHMKKDCQRYLDYYVAENKCCPINLTYKYVYLNRGLLHKIMVQYNLSKINNAIRNVGVSCEKAAEAFSNALQIFSADLTMTH